MKSKTLKKFVILIAFVLFGGACVRVADPLTAIEKRQLNTAEIELVSSDNRFGVKTFKNMALSAGDSNVFISPLSISMALGMTLNGAAGETRIAMKETLELHSLTQQKINESYLSLITLLTQLDPKVIFKIANSIWYRDYISFKQEFINTNKHYFNAHTQSLNFGDPLSLVTINQWVSDNTHGKIPKIINQINPDDIMFLINAIYFKGIWTYRFKPELTQQSNFNHPNGNSVPCQLMHQERVFSYLKNEEIQAINLPYGDGDFRMAIILPENQTPINTIIQNMSDEQLYIWLNSFHDQKGILEFPKFKFAYEKRLNHVLSKLGMAIAFDQERADFTNLYDGSGKAYISEVKHKSFIQVDEEGTEAAAATSVTISFTSVGDEFYMRVDRPFIFILYDNHSKTILFIGKINEPIWEN